VIPILIALSVILIVVAIGLGSLRGLIHNCAPNEVLIFAGARRTVGDREFGYRLIKGGTGVRVPLLEEVSRMDLTNMIIDIIVTNAYAKGGVPLTVQGVANVKIAGHEPVLNNAIERFMDKPRGEIMEIAKATLEGSLRGILATLTPEQVNEDMILFADRLVKEVDQDMTDLGLVVDTMKIQNVQDEVGYLNALGRKTTAEMIRTARIAESRNRADSRVRSAENLERESQAQITAEITTVRADAAKRLLDAQTRRNAVVAEEQATVLAGLAQAQAELVVQNARIEQARGRLDADIIQPAKARCEAQENQAKAAVASILEEGKARASALRSLAASWDKAGDSAREIFVLQKLEPIIRQITSTIAETGIERLTVIDQGKGGGGGSMPARLVGTLEQIKEIYGIDLVEKLKTFGETKSIAAGAPTERAAQPGISAGPPPVA